MRKPQGLTAPQSPAPQCPGNWLPYLSLQGVTPQQLVFVEHGCGLRQRPDRHDFCCLWAHSPGAQEGSPLSQLGRNTPKAVQKANFCQGRGAHSWIPGAPGEKGRGSGRVRGWDTGQLPSPPSVWPRASRAAHLCRWRTPQAAVYGSAEVGGCIWSPLREGRTWHPLSGSPGGTSPKGVRETGLFLQLFQ